MEPEYYPIEKEIHGNPFFKPSFLNPNDGQSFKAREHFSQWGSNSEVLTAEDKDQCDLDVLGWWVGGEMCIIKFVTIMIYVYILRTFVLHIDHYDLL